MRSKLILAHAQVPRIADFTRQRTGVPCINIVAGAADKWPEFSIELSLAIATSIAINYCNNENTGNKGYIIMKVSLYKNVGY